MNIFEIQQEYYDILLQLEENEGEITPELEDLLKINRDNLEAKIKAYYYYIKQNEGNISSLKDEIDRLRTKQASIENTNTRLKENIKQALLLYGESGKSGNLTLKFANLTVYNIYHKPLVIEDEEDFKSNIDNKDYLRIKYEIDKKAIKDAIIKDGVDIDGAKVDMEANYIVMK